MPTSGMNVIWDHDSESIRAITNQWSTEENQWSINKNITEQSLEQ